MRVGVSTPNQSQKEEEDGGSADKGLVISIEGIQGAGKTTLARGLVRHIQRYIPHRTIYLYQLPDFTQPTGPLLRDYQQLLATLPGDEQATYHVHFLSALNKIELQERICQHVQEGHLVLLDGYLLTAEVRATLDACNEAVTFLHQAYCLQPDLVLWLNLDPHLAIERTPLLNRNERLQIMESARLFQTLAEAWSHQPTADENECGNIAWVDASQSPSQVEMMVWTKFIAPVLARRTTHPSYQRGVPTSHTPQRGVPTPHTRRSMQPQLQRRRRSAPTYHQRIRTAGGALESIYEE